MKDVLTAWTIADVEFNGFLGTGARGPAVGSNLGSDLTQAPRLSARDRSASTGGGAGNAHLGVPHERTLDEGGHFSLSDVKRVKRRHGRI